MNREYLVEESACDWCSLEKGYAVQKEVQASFPEWFDSHGNALSREARGKASREMTRILIDRYGWIEGAHHGVVTASAPPVRCVVLGADEEDRLCLCADHLREMLAAVEAQK